jgi:molybdopterin converting factor subunit 1
MKIPVRLFAVAKELAGCETATVDVPAAATLADVRDAVGKQIPALKPVLHQALWAVDEEFAGDETAVSEYSDIALIPPVSGG